MRLDRAVHERVAQLVWTGPDGLRSLLRRVECASRAPESFAAEARTVRCGRVLVAQWRSTELRGRAPRGGDLVVIALVDDGAVRVRTGHGVLEARRGGVVVAPPEGWDVAVSDGARVLALLVPRAVVATAGARMPVAPAVLPDDVRRIGVARSLRALTELALAETAAPSAHLAESLRHLALSILEPHGDDADDVRARISRHIDRHLSDPALGPASIARGFNLSLRAVHYAFSGGGETLARTILRRRVDAVARAVRADPPAARARGLAAAHGFAGRDQLARAFRGRYRLTLGEFAAAVASGEDPQPR